ncbi:MAG: helix-turn-helix domain-containing protein [Oscillospiraceae bacterium]|nr:helix-turn-helix domain-containing protein [Oscillospiraceae bacterium]
MSIKEKMDKAKESTWFSESLSQEERNTAIYIGQIAVIIQRQRKARGYTQHDLANKIGVSQAMVSRWENGEENFTIATLAKISAALDIEWNNPLEKRAV